MLKSLTLENFTVFKNSQLRFGKHLNVFVGENGSGKTHVLKAAYCAIAASATSKMGWGEEGSTPVSKPSRGKSALRFGGHPGLRQGRGDSSSVLYDLRSKFTGVFRPDSLGHLVRRGSDRARLAFQFDDSQRDLTLSFAAGDQTPNALRVANALVSGFTKRPVFLPSRELLTIYPNFVSLYESSFIPFEETWRDTCILLGQPYLRDVDPDTGGRILAMLEASLGGRVVLNDSGKFYLELPSGPMEMDLVPEGLRKLAMIAQLVANGALRGDGFLFWDEPEANLNPKLIKSLAPIVLAIAECGVQVFLATHSLFLLRELHLLQRAATVQPEIRYFGLHLRKKGGVSVKQGKTVDDIGEIVALDEELLQTDRYMNVEMGFGVTDEDNAA